jgi:SAM-dependent methyltransferase
MNGGDDRDLKPETLERRVNSLEDAFQEMNQRRDLHLYGELAPVYDFVYGEMYDYEAQAEKIRDNSLEKAESILELACGTGRLLEKLREDFETRVGVDTGSGCVEIARERNPEAKIHQEDMAEFETEQRFDVVAVMGYSLGALAPGELEKLFSMVSKVLREGGVLVVEHEEEESTDGGFTEETFEGEKFEVTVRSITVKEQEKDRFTMSYELQDKDSDQKRSAGEIHDWHHHETEKIIELLKRKGFEARIVEEETEIYGSDTETIVAEKKED